MKTTLVIDRMENGWAVLDYAQEGITLVYRLFLCRREPVRVM